MLILTIRTDQPEAQLALYNDTQLLAEKSWHAHRQLAETIHTTLQQLLEAQQKTLQDLQGVVCFKGPGSFTGLRIGLSVGNALAYSLKLPIVSEDGDDWAAKGLAAIEAGANENVALPEYGAPVHITQQKK